MLQAFSSSDSLVHAVDLSGLTARGDARQQTSEPTSRSGRESLSEMAQLSGGRLFKDTNDPGQALGEIAEHEPALLPAGLRAEGGARLGQFHKLKVKVRGKGRDVSHRSGYFERTAYAERTPLARRFEAAEVIAKGIVDDEIPLRVSAVPYRADAADAVRCRWCWRRTARRCWPEQRDAAGPRDLRLRARREGHGGRLRGPGLDLRASRRRARALRERGLQCTPRSPCAPGRLRCASSCGTRQRPHGLGWLDVTVPAFDAVRGHALPAALHGRARATG